MVLRAPNILSLIKGKPKTTLTDVGTAGTATLTVESISGFAVGNYVLIGQFGDQRSEIVRVHTATAPSGSTITLNANMAYRHEIGTPVYFIDYNQVEFSRSTTEGGSKSTLTTSDISAGLMESIYDDTANSTGYGYFRFKNSAATTYSAYSDAIPYAGYKPDAVQSIIDRALNIANVELNPRLTYDFFYGAINDFVDIVNEENTQWSEAKVLNHELKTLETGDFEIAIPSNLRRQFDPSSVIAVHTQQYSPLRYVPERDWNELTRELVLTTNTAVINDSDTSIVLTNSANFTDSGTIYIDGDAISYTGNTRSTNTLTGVTGIVSGGHTAESNVLQYPSIGTPVWWTFSSEGHIRLWPVADASVNNRTLYMDYYRSLPYATSQGTRLLLRNVSPAIQYLAYRIKKQMAGGSLSLQDPEYQSFISRIRSLLTSNITGQPQRLRIGFPPLRR